MASAEDVLYCGELCEDIYNTADGYTDLEDLRYGVRVKGDTIFVVFRGTANLANGLRDVAVFPPVVLNKYVTHRGFAEAAVKLQNRVLATEVDLPEPPWRMVFTGHSFGAAIAALLAFGWGQKAITFGCPAMHFWFAPRPVINHERIVCDDDPIPHLPAIFGRHTCDPTLVLKDRDHSLIDVKDHSMSVYNARLRAWAKGRVVP